MKLATVLNNFQEVLLWVEQPARPRKYTYEKRNDTLGLCAGDGHETDLATIAKALTDLMPKACPDDMFACIAALILIDQSSRHLRRVVLAVEEDTIFAPCIAYAALHARTPIVAEVRYFSAHGVDKCPETAPKVSETLEATIIAGRSRAMKDYVKTLSIPSNVLAIHIHEADYSVFDRTPDNVLRGGLMLGDLRCEIEFWSSADV